MKILYFSTSIIPSKFANSVQVMKMCNALAVNNNVTLVAQKGELAEKDVYEYYDVKKAFNIDYCSKRFSFFSRLLKLLTIIKEYDLIYTRYVLCAVVSAFFFRKRTILEIHGIDPSFLNRLFIRCLFLSRLCLFVFITENLRKAVFKDWGVKKYKQSIVLPDGADKNDSIHISYKSKPKTCGFIGSFQKGKGVEKVIKIANQLPSIIFHIVGGNAKEIEALQKNAPQNIVWHGFLAPKEAMIVLDRDIDITLLPNREKMLVGKRANCDIGKFTSPMKLFEYMSYGKAVIASDLPVLKEILIDHQNALLVQAEDINAWETAIFELVQNNELYNKLRINAYNDLQNKYTWDKRVYRLMNFVKNYFV